MTLLLWALLLGVALGAAAVAWWSQRRYQRQLWALVARLEELEGRWLAELEPVVRLPEELTSGETELRLDESRPRRPATSSPG